MANVDRMVTAEPCSQVVIEPANWRDLNAVKQLERVCFPQDAWPLWDLVGVLTLPSVVRLKATCNGEMIGFIAGDLRRSEGLAWIATIGVLPDFRQQGVGTALLRACEERLPVGKVRLSVRASNQTAIQLYSHRDYHQVGIWPRYYTDGEDAFIFEKNL
jgi:ribosomal protein S18 acetylase RimI-like enzyme